RYDEALTLLGQIRQPQTAEVYNYLGYATRKSGDVEGGLAYYRRALEIDPGYTLARSYMGEALIIAGRRDDALAQLGEIKERCGMGCREYVILARALTGVTDSELRQTW
ncbi:MAG TPA: tetratricopeptide repeat protein, partial [Rhizobiaceae bacterium]|nr:tetratricopeptide repeat protein [Rhizobiaceae bacterium]